MIVDLNTTKLKYIDISSIEGYNTVFTKNDLFIEVIKENISNDIIMLYIDNHIFEIKVSVNLIIQSNLIHLNILSNLVDRLIPHIKYHNEYIVFNSIIFEGEQILILRET